jgi:hypothetical protein
MKPEVLLIWLALFGSDADRGPSALAHGIGALPTTPVTWTGDWLVRGERRAISADIFPVRGREQLAGRLTFGDGPTAIVEHWIGRRDGRWLELTRSGVGEGRMLLTDTGRLVGHLRRHDAAGDINLSLRE